MDMKFKDLIDDIDRIVKNPLDRSKLVSLTIGLALGSAFPIPAMAADSPDSYFVGILEPQVSPILSAFNENAIINLRDALAYTRATWLMRYEAVYPKNLIPNTCYGFFDTFFSVEKYVSPEDHCFVNDHKDEIFQLLYSVRLTMERLRSA